MAQITEDLSALGFRMPAEWEDHTATWLAWPYQTNDWPGKFTAIPWVYCEIIKNLALSETVRLIVKDSTNISFVSDTLALAGVNLKQVEFVIAPTNRSWIRDFGPIFVKDKHHNKGVLDFGFNAWAKYENFSQDDNIPNIIASTRNLSTWQPKVNNIRTILEGGSIDVDGMGTLLTTEECLLSKVQQRNLGFTKSNYEDIFARYLGVKKVLWLGTGIEGDDTHGHVDDLTRFVAKGKVVTVVEQNKSDVNYKPLQENLSRLQEMSDADGQKLEVIELPMPSPITFEGVRLPASYANFYIGNKVVLVPTFNDANDRLALNILAQLFPKKNIVGIHCVDLVWGLGTIHCLSQQEPC